MSQRMAIGFGAASRVTCQDVLALIRRTVAEISSDTLLATLDRREAIAREVAEALQVQLVLFSADELSPVCGVANASNRVLQAVGSASVAEASALASLGAGARLLIPRRVGYRCTCAVAVLA